MCRMKNPSLKRAPFFLTCFACICFGSSSSYAQNEPVKFEKMTTENGLPSNIIYCIIQDSKGFLWLGTNEGLCRYDGYDFKVFRHDPADSNSLSANYVASLCEDGDGNIWAATSEGLSRYNYSKDNFSYIKINNSDSKEIDQLIAANKDELFVVLSRDDFGKVRLINIHNLKNSYITHQTHSLDSFYCYNSLQPIFKTEDRKFYLSGVDYFENRGKVVYEFDEKQKKLKDFLYIHFPKGTKSDYVSHFFTNKYNQYLIGSTYGHLSYIDSNEKKKNGILNRSVKMEPNPIYDVLEEDKNNFWIGAQHGIYVYNPFNGTINEKKYKSLINSIGDGEVCSIFRDATGVIWVGSFKGLYKIMPTNNYFRHISAGPDGSLHILDNSIFGIYSFSGNKAFIQYLNVPMCSSLDMEKGSLYSFSKKKNFDKEIFYLSNHPDSIDINKLDKYLSILKYSDDPAKINCLNELTGILNYCFQNKYPALKQKQTDITDYAWNDSVYWLATSTEGLIRIQKFKGSITKILPSNGINSISSPTVTCLLLKGNGDLWIGTNGGGLNFYDSKKKVFSYYSTKDGLPDNSIYNLILDDKSRLWIGTGKGLSCLDPITYKFKNFFRSDGLINSEFNRHSACKLTNGYILMGGMDGIDYFNPDSVLNKDVKPTIQITDFRIYNRPVPVASSISLAHDQNYITILFAAMDFRNVETNKFAYKLEGIDKDWILSNQNSVSYATLSPGHYHFLVKASGSNGVWSDIPAEIYFSISMPWWKAWWFIFLVGLSVMSALYAIYRFRIRQLKRLIVVRTKISQDLHDEVGATLTSISFLSEVAKQQTGSTNLSAQSSIEKIGEFSRDMIGEMNDIVWAINPTNDKFEKIEDRMQNFASVLLASKNIQFVYKSDHQIQNIFLGMQQRKNLYLIFKEAVSNAAKYSDCAEVSVNVVREGHHIHLDIADNGKGFTIGNVPNGNGGNGLYNMQQRANEIKAEISIQSIPGKGTRISLSMPITQNAY
jgi:anti-sigma regulatory factor (Ser/Thr protein kinase)